MTKNTQFIEEISNNLRYRWLKKFEQKVNKVTTKLKHLV